MNYLKTNAIVVMETPIRESDKIVVLLSEKKGKISCLVRGARKSTSKFAASTQFLCYSNFTLFKSKGMYVANECEPINLFYGIRGDIVKLTYASHVTDIANDVIQENQPPGEILTLFLNALHMLSNTQKAPSLISAAFELKMACLAGYMPKIGACIHCGTAMNDEPFWFSFKNRGIVCSKCRNLQDEPSVKMLGSTLQAIRYIANAQRKDIFRFKLCDAGLKNLKRIAHRYLEEQLDRQYPKLQFLEKI